MCDQCVKVSLQSSPVERAHLYAHTTGHNGQGHTHSSLQSNLVKRAHLYAHTLPDTMIKATPIPLRKEFTNFVLRYLKKEDFVKLWSLARTSTNYCILNYQYYGQKDRDGQLMMTLDEIYVYN